MMHKRYKPVIMVLVASSKKHPGYARNYFITLNF